MVHWYDVMMAVGFMAGLWTASRRSPREGIAPEKITDLVLWLIIGSIAGARIHYVVEYWHEQFAGKPFYEVFMIQHGGQVFYGGPIVPRPACTVFFSLKKLPSWKLPDGI